MKYLFDREQIRTAVFRGYAVIGNDQPIPPGIKRDLEAYYADPNAPIKTKINPRAWQQVQDDLVKFREMKAGSKLVIPREEN